MGSHFFIRFIFFPFIQTNKFHLSLVVLLLVGLEQVGVSFYLFCSIFSPIFHIFLLLYLNIFSHLSFAFLLLVRWEQAGVGTSKVHFLCFCKCNLVFLAKAIFFPTLSGHLIIRWVHLWSTFTCAPHAMSIQNPQKEKFICALWGWGRMEFWKQSDCYANMQR